jgi:hypothetical protein
MTLAVLGALMTPFNEARADETSMIPFSWVLIHPCAWEVNSQ